MSGLDSAFSLRSVDPGSEQLRDWLGVCAVAFKDPRPVTAERLDYVRPVYAGQRLVAAYANGRLVGTLRSWDLGLTVPGGGRVSADAISSVAVLPTHRRRGAMSAMVRADLRAAAERGVPVAILIASEAPIYGRFGFGPATEVATWTVDLRTAEIRPEAPDLCQALIVSEDELRATGPVVYQAARRPGAIDRSDQWWDANLGVVPVPGQEHGTHIGVLAVDGTGKVQGFLRYRTENAWVDRVSASVVHVEELHVVGRHAYPALWRYLVELDLAATVRADERPVDEPLPWLLTDPRAARQSARNDFEWTRLLDPAAALSARGYESAGQCVLQVLDQGGPAAGRYLLEADGGGTGHCARTGREPDLVLPVQTLSTLWLGGGDLLAALLAGRAQEERPGAGLRLAALLRTGHAPWANTWF